MPTNPTTSPTVAVWVWCSGPLCRPPPQDDHHGAGRDDPFARLLPLRRVSERFLPTRSGDGDRRRVAIAAVTRMTGLVGAMVSFEEGRELLGELAGVSITTKQVERAAEALGAEIADDERQHVHPVIDSEIPPTLYLGMDGTGVPIRQQELLGRAGKQADGSAKTREVKLCTLWSAEGRAPDGTPMRDEGSVTYSAAIESAAQRDVDKQPSAFAARVEREAKRRGFDRAGRQVVLGDGAPWIWNMADEYFPDAVQVVDLFHAKQHLSDVGKAIYGPTSELARQWGRQRHDELDEGRLDALLQALRTHTATHDEARKCVDYIERNRGRMRYTEFRAQGLCTSSGVVEAGCKVAIGHPPQARRHALDRPRGQRDHRPALRQTQRRSRTSGNGDQPPRWLPG